MRPRLLVLTLSSFVAAGALAAGTARAAPIVPPVTLCIDGATITFSDTTQITPAALAFLIRRAQTTGVFFDIAPDGTRTTHTVKLGACPTSVKVGVPGGAFLCGGAYGAASLPDVVTGPKAVEAYLKSPGTHYAVFVQGDLKGPQPAQAAAGVTPAGSFYCVPPASAKPIMGSDGKQLLADTQGWLYPSFLANGETVGHLAYSAG